MARGSALIVLPRLLLLLRRKRPSSGQSLVEFALLLPLLLVLFLGVADFGRVFQAGITMESAARAAAEAGAVEYLRQVTDSDPGVPPNYDHIREVAAAVACQGAQLPNADPPSCATGPAVRVCIHDAAAGDVNCGDVVAGFAPVPAECWEVNALMTPAKDPLLTVLPTDANTTPRGAYVEVRTCYRFTTLFNLNISLPMNTGLSLGEIFLQREAVFTVADY
jgi:TadE-like protein